MKHRISLIGGNDNEVAVIIEETANNMSHLVCKYRGKTIKSSAWDFFEAFCIIRIELEKDNLIPFCYGASLNVYPSGMARDMGAGLRAYRMRMGEDISMDSLVDIFEKGPDVIPATVARQQYFEAWRAS